MVGCSGSLRSTWVNFNSYYNTFYNAEQSYKRGINQFENQIDRINPERPIRIHRAPVRTGQTEFEDAIARASDLLFDYPDSKYVDNALSLIGRSYYFLENYFNAEQKFIELFSITDSDELKQQSVIWRSRIMLDLQRHDEAITYLTNQLEITDFEWGIRERAEAQLIQAQHLVITQQWEEAGNLLYEALPEIKNRDLLARGYFLHGQILEYLELYEAAFSAYDRVRKSNPVYQLIYFSELRKGIVLRKNGEHEKALDLFVKMSRNDNNFDNLSAINYEIGRTLQFLGDYEEAKEMYTDVLYFSFQTPQRETLALTHYGLAELYRYNFRDYSKAAAYYDSSARNASVEEQLPYNFDARSLSRSFNEFARLNEQAEKMDSLIWLGSLPPAKFDSVITVIQEEYRKKMERERRDQERESGRIVSTEPGSVTEADEGGENGFLFHLNRTLVAQASQQFQARWDGRPLVDNWRREEAVRQVQIAAEEDEEIADEIVYVEEVDPIELELDLSEIPRTRQARQTMSEDLARTKYEIGNMFFISLNMPDSARNTYKNIIDRFPSADIIPQTIYSLSELYFVEGDEENSRYWAEVILEDHSKTIFAQRLSERFDLGIEMDEIELAPVEAKIQQYFELLQQIDDLTTEDAAWQLFDFAESDTLTEYAPDAYLASAQRFITLAKENPEFNEKSDRYRNVQQEHDLNVQSLQALKDSANVVLSDTTITDDSKNYWASVKDSTIAEPNYKETFPYIGEYWDYARTSLEQLRERFPQYKFFQRASLLYDEIKLLPDDPEPAEEELEADESEQSEQDEVIQELDTSQVYECTELDIIPSIKGGLESFINNSGVKELMEEMGILQAQFAFRITISHDGLPERVLSLDEEDELGFQEFLLNQIQAEMQFEPLVHQGKRITAICDIQIPVQVSTD